jgi:hypothetical protein
MRNTLPPLSLALSLSVALFSASAGVAGAQTAESIKASVKANSNAVADLTATASVTFQDPAQYVGEDTIWQSNWSSATYRVKAGDKFRVDGSGTDARQVRCNGVTKWASTNGGSTFPGSRDFVRNDFYKLLDPAWLMDNNAWSLAAGTFTVEGVQTYKLTSTNFTVWVDTATSSKVIRTQSSSTGNYAVFSGYSYAEGTAYVPSTIAHHSGASASMTISLSNININEALADSLFQP